jgi:hypothetical protein
VKPVLKTNDVVELSWAQFTLSEADIECIVFDTNNAMVEGSIGVIPRRLMVNDVDESRALWVLKKAREALDAPSDDPD